MVAPRSHARWPNCRNRPADRRGAQVAHTAALNRTAALNSPSGATLCGAAAGPRPVLVFEKTASAFVPSTDRAPRIAPRIRAKVEDGVPRPTRR